MCKGIGECRAITLTINQDTLTGADGNDTFNAGIVSDNVGGTTQSLQNFDKLDGGAGTDTLNVSLGNTTTTPLLSSIEKIVVREVNTLGGTLDLSVSTGVTKLTDDSSVGNLTVASAGALADFTLSNTKKDLTVTGLSAKTIAVAATNAGDTAVGGTASNITLTNATGLDKVTATVSNSHVFINGSNGLTELDVVSNGTANQVGNANVSNVKTVVVTGAATTDLTVDATVYASATSLTAGDGGVKFNATGNTATTLAVTTGAGADTLTLTGANLTTASTGAGKDSVTITSALAATSVVDLGAGDDTLTLSVAPTAGVTLTGGDGTDTLAVAYATYGTISGFTTAQLAKITGFETLSVTDVLADTNSVDLSKVAGLTSFQTAGVAAAGTASVTNVGANAAVIMKGDLGTNTGTLTVALKDATGSSDVLNLTLNASYTEDNNGTANIVGKTETVTASGVETLNVVSTGTPSTAFLGATGTKADGVNNTLALTDTALVTLKVSGDQAFTFNTADTQTKLATVDASALTAGATISAAATVTATNAAITITGSATAANTLTGSANADTIIGGTAHDVITGGAKGDTLTGGGGADYFVFAAGDSSIGTGTFDTITDFAANTYGNGTNHAAGTRCGRHRFRPC